MFNNKLMFHLVQTCGTSDGKCCSFSSLFKASSCVLFMYALSFGVDSLTYGERGAVAQLTASVMTHRTGPGGDEWRVPHSSLCVYSPGLFSSCLVFFY